MTERSSACASQERAARDRFVWAERPLGRAEREGRFGGGAANGVAVRGAPLIAHRGSGNRAKQGGTAEQTRPSGAVSLLFWEVIKGMQRVNPFGIGLLALGVLIVFVAGRRIERQSTKNIVKLIGLFAAMGGALLAICG